MLISWAEKYLYDLVPYGFIGKKVTYTSFIPLPIFCLFSQPPKQPVWLYSFSSSSSPVSFFYSSWYIPSCLFCLCVSLPYHCPTWSSVPSCWFYIKIHILLIVMFFRVSFTCALFQSMGELERFSAAATKRLSLHFSLCQGDNLYCPLTLLPSLYFIRENKRTRELVGFTHRATLKQ